METMDIANAGQRPAPSDWARPTVLVSEGEPIAYVMPIAYWGDQAKLRAAHHGMVLVAEALVAAKRRGVKPDVLFAQLAGDFLS